MTICFVADSYPFARPFGGIAIYTQTAAQALASRGHSVHVLVGWRGPAKDMEDGPVQVHYRPVNWLPLIGKWVPALGESWWLSRAVSELQAKYRFDIIEFPNFEGLGLITEWRGKVPVVVRLHTSMVESIETQNRGPNRGERFMMWAERASARRARAVVTHSLAHRDRLSGVYGLDRIEVIPHGIRIPPPREDRSDPPLVLTLGRLTARKGGPTLLAAIPLILEKVPRARFTIVGAGEDNPKVKEFRRLHPHISADQVVFHEFIDGDELNALYAAATVYASASVYESFGLTFVEAMAREIPVVGCGVSAMNEIIAHEETGLLVPPTDAVALADAVTRLLRDRELRQRLGQAGRQVVLTRYTAERMAIALESWYQTVLARS